MNNVRCARRARVSSHESRNVHNLWHHWTWQMLRDWVPFYTFFLQPFRQIDIFCQDKNGWHCCLFEDKQAHLCISDSSDELLKLGVIIGCIQDSRLNSTLMFPDITSEGLYRFILTLMCKPASGVREYISEYYPTAGSSGQFYYASLDCFYLLEKEEDLCFKTSIFPLLDILCRVHDEMFSKYSF